MSIVNLLLCSFYLIEEYKRKAAASHGYYNMVAVNCMPALPAI
jgi:hypothetical protein